MSRSETIEARLRAALAPSLIEVRDDSAHHAGHSGARSGKGHFHVRIAAPAFASKPLIERHRLIYAALGDMMSTDIHALSLEALTPDQVT